jgi:hypothetical protein
VGLTNLENPCGFHCNQLNSQILQYELVPTFSKFVVLYGVTYCCALIGYSRRSVDEYLVEANVHGTYIDFICSEYLLFPKERKQISPLSVIEYTLSVIEYTLLLDRKY